MRVPSRAAPSCSFPACMGRLDGCLVPGRITGAPAAHGVAPHHAQGPVASQPRPRRNTEKKRAPSGTSTLACLPSLSPFPGPSGRRGRGSQVPTAEPRISYVQSRPLLIAPSPEGGQPARSELPSAADISQPAPLAQHFAAAEFGVQVCRGSVLVLTLCGAASVSCMCVCVCVPQHGWDGARDGGARGSVPLQMRTAREGSFPLWIAPSCIGLESTQVLLLSCPRPRPRLRPLSARPRSVHDTAFDSVAISSFPLRNTSSAPQPEFVALGVLYYRVGKGQQPPASHRDWPPPPPTPASEPGVTENTRRADEQHEFCIYAPSFAFKPLSKSGLEEKSP